MDKNKIQIENYTKDMQKHVRKQQLRDSRRKSGPKNKAKKPRQKEWLPDSWDDLDDLDYTVEERIMPRGEGERRREIERRAFKGSSKKNSGVAVDLEGQEPTPGSHHGIPGLVVGVSSGMCRVDIHSGASPIRLLKNTLKSII